MKRIFILLVAIHTLTSAWARPECVWLNPEYDFGAFGEDLGTVECYFHGVNTGNEPLIITAARANCGCTVPDYDHKPIEPGDTFDLKVRFNANGRPGRFDKKVYVYTNTIKDKYTLTIKGTVIGSQNTVKSRYPVDAGEVRLNSTFIPMGDAEKGHSVTAYLKAYNVSDRQISPALTGLPPYLSYEVRGDKVNPGEQFVISLTAFSDKCRDWGLVTDTLTFIPDTGSSLKIPITTVLNIREDFSKMSDSDLKKAPKAVIDTEKVDFGRFERNGNTITEKVNIRNDGGGKPLFVRKVSTPAKGVTVTLGKHNSKKGTAKGEEIPLLITVDPGQVPDNEILNARITLITNDPDNPTRIIRVVGEPVP